MTSLNLVDLGEVEAKTTDTVATGKFEVATGKFEVATGKFEIATGKFEIVTGDNSGFLASADRGI